MTSTDRLIELRVLDGPNLHLRRPAIRLRLDVRHVLDATVEDAAAWAQAVGLRAPITPGEVRSSARLAFAQRLCKRLVRLVSERTGVERLRVEVRPGWDDGEVVVAFPWRRLGPAEELGRWVAYAVEDLPLLSPDAVTHEDGTVGPDLGEWERTLAKAVVRIADAPEGERAHVPDPGIPTIGITGTNGKTTTTRLLAHLAMVAGKRTAWNSTDGVYVDGELTEAGDYAGFNGTARVLATEGVEVAVLEQARGGLLRRGMGVAALDVAVVTNVSADHLGLMGVHTLDQLAEVKAIPTRAVRRSGWTVLNAQDPRVLAMRHDTPGRVCVFSLDPDAPGVRDVLRAGGRAVTVVDGQVAVLRPGADPDVLVPITDIPVTLAGLSRNNLANALAATAAALSAGIPVEAVVTGLRTFEPDPERNPARLNVWVRDGVTVVVDIAHNEASYVSLLEVCRGLRAPDATLHALVGTIGDRTPEIMRAIGEAAARGADDVVFVEKAKYLRDADADEVVAALQAGAAAVGQGPFPVEPDEVDALDHVLARATEGDVVAFAVHAHLGEVHDVMRARDFRPATSAEIAVMAKDSRR